MVVYTQADGNKLNNLATPSSIDTMHTEVYTGTYKTGINHSCVKKQNYKYII